LSFAQTACAFAVAMHPIAMAPKTIAEGRIAMA